MPEVRVRPAEPADAQGVTSVHYAAVHTTAAMTYPADILDHWSGPVTPRRIENLRAVIVGGEETVLVAEIDGEIVGFGSVVPSNNELRAVYVDPKAGRRGVGTRLVEALEAIAVRNGVEHLDLDSSLNAERFYQRLGYSVLSRGTHELASGIQMPCVYMRKVLKAGS